MDATVVGRSGRGGDRRIRGAVLANRCLSLFQHSVHQCLDKPLLVDQSHIFLQVVWVVDRRHEVSEAPCRQQKQPLGADLVLFELLEHSLSHLLDEFAHCFGPDCIDI